MAVWVDIVFKSSVSACVCMCVSVSDFTPQAVVQSTSRAAMATRLAPPLLPHGKCANTHRQALEHTLARWNDRHKASSVTHTAGRLSFLLNYTGFSAKRRERTGRGGQHDIIATWQPSDFKKRDRRLYLAEPAGMLGN